MAKKDVISSPMSRAPWQKISEHGNVKIGVETKNGCTQAAMVPLKGKPAGIDSPMADVPNPKRGRR